MCTLLFVRDKKLVAFTSVYRNIIDFSQLGKDVYKADESIRIMNKIAGDCQ